MSSSNVITIAEPSNLTLEVIEHDKSVIIQRDQDAVELRRLASKSTETRELQEAGGSYVVLKDDDLAAMEIRPRALHNKGTEQSYTVAVSVLRKLFVIADKYLIADLQPACTWFRKWFSRWDSLQQGVSNIEAVPELYYPTWRFDHATAFARVSKFLAYEDTGHIQESLPLEGTHLKLPPRIIRKQASRFRYLDVAATDFIYLEQLNAAKGRLWNILNQHLLDLTKQLFAAKCCCKDRTFFGYGKALCDVNVP
ncbi:MAG: hypothetical protein Q9184_008216 [Pyrenodesmia sp. 2 TL-2023]